MSGHRANPTIVGAFLIGAIVLAVGSVMIFGGKSLLRGKYYCVMYFEESVGGLDVGATLELKGVRLGTVSDIEIVHNPQTGEIRIPVTAELEPVHDDRKGPSPELPVAQGLQRLIDQGLRAQLVSQSLLTGKLKVQLDFWPDIPARLVGEAGDMPEIPTIPSPVTAVIRRLEQLPLSAIVDETYKTLKALGDVLRSGDLPAALAEIKAAATDLQAVVRTLDAEIGPASAALQEASVSVDTSISRVAGEIQTLTRAVDEQIRPALAAVTEAASALTDAVDPESDLRRELTRAAAQLAEAARTARALSETLERQPEALLRGKKDRP